MWNWIKMGMLQRKVTRSEWMTGLLAAESDVESCGYKHCRWAILDAQRTGICSYFSSWTQGYDDYLSYYKVKLKNN